ncbi:DUF3078 domain-containing protein [Flavisolibacter nicotianae]|uniref:DUF3078 domain-containing protein n=1 Tax=Flavisolibacter nicotianae TaxID=2364882 RepID=UPI000EAD644B|nr:DUF3078 domain-containing protein [Flavisolibacter nicotianae]
MKKAIFLACLSCLFLVCSAQDETVKKLKDEAGKTIKKGEADTIAWRRGGLYNLNLAQGSLSNWAAGGDDFSLSLTSYLNLFSFYKKDKHSWDNTLDFNFGYIRTTSLGSRKNDDRLDLLSKYGYALDSTWNLALLANFRSQLAKGYTYPDNVKTFSSAFLSPAYLLASLGFDYKPGPNFSFFISPATIRWVIVKDDTLSAKGLYGVEPGKHSKSEFGAFASANYIKTFNKSLQYRGRLDLFSNYRHNPQNIDLFMTNVFSVSVSKVLTASWNLDFIYDDDARLFGKNGKSPALQVKSLVGLGLQMKF